MFPSKPPELPEITEDVYDERDKVVSWRAAQLLEAGYDPRTAEKIAQRCQIDLHRACEMLSQGCEPELAAKILV
jgi:hypothetical protein